MINRANYSTTKQNKKYSTAYIHMINISMLLCCTDIKDNKLTRKGEINYYNI